MKVAQGFPTGPDIPFLDDAGNISLVWYQWLVAIWQRTGGAAGESSVNSLAGASGDITVPQLVTAGIAPLASPDLTGLPTAPTAAPGVNTTQIATTAYVMAETALAIIPLATLASPGLTGIPTAPTPPNDTNTAQLATTAFVSNIYRLHEEVVTVGASPFAYTPPISGAVIVSGGTITAMTLKRNFGTAYETGSVAGSFRMTAHDTIEITYSVAPTMVFFPS